MTIRQRITLLVVLTFLAISLIGGIALLQTRASAREVAAVTAGVVPTALASADLVSELKDVQLGVLALVASPSADLAKQELAALEEKKARLNAGLDAQAAAADGVAQQGLVQQSRESLTNYFDAIDQTAQLKLGGQQVMAEGMLNATVAQYLREMETTVDTLRIEKNRAKDAAIEALNDTMASTIRTISAVTLIVVAGLSLLGFLLYRQIVVPITRMQQKMSEIAEHQDFSQRLAIVRDDEIGRSTAAFNRMIEKIQESSALLRQKTNDMQTMLQNMPQGILTIMHGSLVHAEYSAHLESILGTGDIAGRNVIELLFAGTRVGADVVAQVDAAVAACVGEEALNFEFNAHLLVGEIERAGRDGNARILDLNWSPILDEHDRVDRILLCVRDVTELRRLAAEANAQKRELEMIGEILGVPQEKFFEFVENATMLLDDNERIIHKHPVGDDGAIDQMFRNMHTVKGNARTYALRHLTNIVHESEQTYDELRKKRPNVSWDQAVLLDELETVKVAVAHYARINEVGLNRKGPGRRGSVERYLLVDRKEIDDALHRLETVNTANMHELLAARDAVRNALRLIGTERLASALAGVCDSLPSLAQELGKVPPIIEIDDGGHALRNQGVAVVKNIVMHLVRNSLDHGLESPEERLISGKPAAGTIRVAAQVAGTQLTLTLEDDGRGLALARIRALAIERGLLDGAQPGDDAAVAATILRAGFSTAEQVTEVSGRGVGMDAVAGFARKEQGEVAIRFLDDAEGASFRRFQTVITLPAQFAVPYGSGDDAKVIDAEAAGGTGSDRPAMRDRDVA